MPQGMVTAYDLTVGVKVNMDEAIYMLSPQDTPLLTGVGGDGLVLLSSAPVDEIQFDWMHDTILTPRSTLGALITGGQNYLTVAAGEQTRFSTGDIIKIASPGNTTEHIRVTGYGSTTDSLTLTRAYAGTAMTYATSAVVVGLGTALAEGSAPENARTVDRTQVSNLTQIFGPTKVDMSRTERLVSKYGVGDEWAHQVMARTKENAIAREQALLYGTKTQSTTTKIRTTAGLFSFISTNVTTATTLDVTTLTAVQLTGYNRGGFADVTMANPVAMATLNAAADTAIVRQMVDSPMRGRVRVSFVETEFGSALMVRNRWMMGTDAIGFDRAQAIRRVMTPLIYEQLAKVGDSVQGQIVCEEGLEFKGEAHAWKMNSLGYTGYV
jgi:hypothetical protein